MFNILQYVQVLFAISCVLSAPQDVTENEVSGDMDYHEPGIATENCLCVPLYQCEDGNIITDGRGMLDPRNKKQDEELGLDDIYVPPECGPYHVCCGNTETSTVQPYEHRCGNRNPGGIRGRIATQHATGEADFGEWPWTAIILLREGSEMIFKCGATLIDETHVITIAHCVDKLMNEISNVVVRLGEWDLRDKSELNPHEDYNVSDIFIHPEYRSNNLHHDIAVVRLDREVHFKPYIDTACLPRDDDDFTGQECIVTGWGTDAYRSNNFSMIMKEVSVPVISNAQCQDMLRNTRLGKYFQLHSSFICAGGKEGEDACRSDGGGPLVCYRSDNSYTVAGLVSWGIDCGLPDVPGVYVNVKKYIDWIMSITRKQLQEYWSSP